MIWRLNKGLGIPAESLIKVRQRHAAWRLRGLQPVPEAGAEFIDENGVRKRSVSEMTGYEAWPVSDPKTAKLANDA
jgi:hypothetical protein